MDVPEDIDVRNAMSGLFKKNRTSRLRAIRVYLLVILIFALLLFCFSIISLNEQRQKAKELSTSNLRFMGEQMALDLERQMEVLATDCLSRRNIERLSYTPGIEQPLEKLRGYREQFEILEKIYPIAEHFFIFDQDRLVFPRISSPQPQILNLFQSAAYSPSFEEFSKLLEEGEHRELQLRDPARAVDSYRSALKLDVNARLKALAMFRTARALRDSGRKALAEETFQTLLRLYGDQYDEFQTPYILSLAIQPEELTQKIFPSSLQSLNKIYRDLIGGKWELSADQTERFMTRLEQQLRLPPANLRASKFFDHFQFAKAASQKLDFARTSPPFKIAVQSFKNGSENYQTYRVSIQSDKNRNVIVGFSVSIPGLNDLLASTYAKDPKYGVMGTISLVGDSEIEDGSVSDRDIYVPFQTILPFWQLHIPVEAMQLSKIAISRELWFIGISVFMFLCILGLGLFLFIRVSWDIRWFQLRSDFVSGVSHEFKTPLSLIRLYSETLTSDGQDFAPEEQKSYIRIIARESARLSHLINNVLDFSKMEQVRRRQVLPEGDLTVIVSQAINDYSEYLTQGGFTVESSIPPELPPVRFNPEQVSQMIVNLLDNATKYSGTSRLLQISVWQQGNEVVLEVGDKGIGIPAEEKERIFQPFYRLSRASEKGGCGLGLYLVDQVMKEHSGRVEVESEVDQGSRFRLVFPVSTYRRAVSKIRSGNGFRKATGSVSKDNPASQR